MNNDRFSRQSFLGDTGQANIERCTVGIIGVGGGGTHIADQFPHIGFLNYVLFDFQDADESNMNRLVIATEGDIDVGTAKIELARRKILGVDRTARVNAFKCRWQERPEVLRACDLIIGCVDTFAERRELETCCRRYLIPYIDIGMDLHQVSEEAPVMGGQVILSMPGYACMFCLGFLGDEKLSREAAKYGAVGGRAQVVWPNGVLASTAVGIAVDLLTDWTRALRGPVYLSYRGNDGTITPHVRLEHLPAESCLHFPPEQVGDPVLL